MQPDDRLGSCAQRGRICMDMSMIDLTDLPGVDVGDEVEIFGPPESRWRTMAAPGGDHPYELTCAVSKRVPRVYHCKTGRVTERELLLRFLTAPRPPRLA
ncbi:MAG: alanine racemase C-terminal domain-containing protein [Dysosmobacter sp.]